MKIYHAVLCALGVSLAGRQVEASVLYGSTSAGGAGELWTINAATGAGIQDVGPLDDSASANYAVTGMAFDKSNGVLYGSTGGKTGTELLTINPATAAVTVVGNFNAGGATMTDLAFSPAGTLYGIGSSGGPTLYTINIATGQATAVGPSGLSATSGGGLAISPGGVFYGTPLTNDFGTYNSTTGAYTNITNPAKPAGATASYASLAYDGNTLYGMDLGSPTHLVTIDPSGNVTDIGSSVPSIDGIAFVPEPCTAAVLAMAMTSFGVARRRR